MTSRSIYSVNASYQLICAPMERGMCKISSPFPASLYPTPADRLKGRTLQSSGRPCLSPSIRQGQAPRVGLPSQGSRLSHPMKPVWASMVLSTFPERKVDRPPGRDPANIIEASRYMTQNADHQNCSQNLYRMISVFLI